MNSQQLSIMASIQAAVARVKGMEAANQQRVVSGESIAYSEDHFLAEAQHLEQLSILAANTPE